MGERKEFQDTLELKQGVVPKFFYPRSVCAFYSECDRRLLDADLLRKVKSSLWATPIIPVLRNDGRLRLCRDYEVTVNQSLQIDQHPLPKPDECLLL